MRLRSERDVVGVKATAYRRTHCGLRTVADLIYGSALILISAPAFTLFIIQGYTDSH